jgi:hypothetical protein
MTPKEQYNFDVKEASARYAEDRAICNDERNDGQRMKCLRTAKGENTQMLAEAKARMKAAGGAQRPGACDDCAKVVSVNVAERKGDSNALGMIAGGVGGALLGNQVGSGSGKKVATVAGAVGGAYAGKKIQENMNSKKIWNVEVEYDNGQRKTFSFEQDPGMQRGDKVRNAGPSIRKH